MKKPNLNLKVPQLGRKSKGVQSRPALKPPQFAADLYADLRDRRLLPLIAVLAVAIVAAPILLAGEGEEDSPLPPPAPSGATAAAQASFAVVPADAGLRDYRKRLGHREARNPFRQPPAPVSEAKSSGGEAAGADAAAATGGGADSAPVSEAPSSSPVDAEAETTTDVVVEREIVGYTLDIHAGFEDPLKEQKGVPPMTKLPNEKNPVVSYIGLSKDNKRALFLLDSTITAYYGPVRCSLDKETCSVVEVKPGKTAIFVYGLGDTKYRLKLDEIVPVVRTREEAATVTTREDQSRNAAPQPGP